MLNVRMLSIVICLFLISSCAENTHNKGHYFVSMFDLIVHRNDYIDRGVFLSGYVSTIAGQDPIIYPLKDISDIMDQTSGVPLAGKDKATFDYITKKCAAKYVRIEGVVRKYGNGVILVVEGIVESGKEYRNPDSVGFCSYDYYKE